MEELNCPCGLDATFEACCGVLIRGEKKAETAEELMRSRYSAYARVEMDYLYETTHPTQREDYDRDGSKEWAERSDWHGIEILSKEAGTAEDSEGVVEFLAKYSQGGKLRRHHEIATFVKEDGVWFFEDGKIVAPKPVKREVPKVGRNDLCPCGSGKKYKKCCIKKEAA